MKFQRICYPYSSEKWQITPTTSFEGLLRPFIKELNLKKFCMKSEWVNVRILNQKLFYPIVPRIGFSLSCRVVIICFCKGLLYSCTPKYYTARTVENLQIDSLSELESLNCIVVYPGLLLLTASRCGPDKSLFFNSTLLTVKLQTIAHLIQWHVSISSISKLTRLACLINNKLKFGLSEKATKFEKKLSYF